MKDVDVRNVIGSYCSIAKLKETERESKFLSQANVVTSEITATHVFGAQQLAWLYWSESRSKVDPFKVNALLAFCEIRDTNVPNEIKVFIDEFNNNITLEAKFAHMCRDLEDWLQSFDSAYTKELAAFLKKNYSKFPIRRDELKRVISHYNILSALKYKTRRGWVCWNVNVAHREVVSEHVFGTQSLAWLIHLATQSQLNMSKVIAMLTLHETEESIMEDYIPSDLVNAEQMLEEGKAAVAQALGGLNQYGLFTFLLDEFNARKTPEASFAHLCDKLECNFRAKMYTDLGLCPIENGTEAEKANPEVVANIAKGAKTVSDLFLMHIMHEYVGTPFEEIANCLKDYDTTQA